MEANDVFGDGREKNRFHKKASTGDFPGASVVKTLTPDFQGRGCGFSPWLGN